jgi:hypothetical protein
MRTLIILITLICMGCGKKTHNSPPSNPSFVAFQLRSVGVHADQNAPNTLSSADLRIENCSNSADNRDVVIASFKETHLENLTSGSENCRMLLLAFTMQGGNDAARFTPQNNHSPLEISNGNASTYSSASQLAVRVEVEKSLSQKLTLKENISLSFLPLFGIRRINAKVSYEDFLGKTPVPQLIISSIEYSGILTTEGIKGYTINLSCTETLSEQTCAGSNLMSMRFRLLDSMPTEQDRQNLDILTSDYTNLIIPNDTHLRDNGFSFSVTTKAQIGSHIAFLARSGDAVRLFDIQLPSATSP